MYGSEMDNENTLFYADVSKLFSQALIGFG